MTLCLRNRQRACAIDLHLLRRILRFVLGQDLKVPDYELCFHFVTAKEMGRINEKFLGHAGPTDVITFDQGETDILQGEIFICPEVAVSQAKEFRASWQEEIVRYAVHGLLHLQGHDDRAARARRKMKREEDRLVTGVLEQFAVARLRRKPAR